MKHVQWLTVLGKDRGIQCYFHVSGLDDLRVGKGAMH